jgi:hypothetical protein
VPKKIETPKKIEAPKKIEPKVQQHQPRQSHFRGGSARPKAPVHTRAASGPPKSTGAGSGGHPRALSHQRMGSKR